MCRFHNFLSRMCLIWKSNKSYWCCKVSVSATFFSSFGFLLFIFISLSPSLFSVFLTHARTRQKRYSRIKRKKVKIWLDLKTSFCSDLRNKNTLICRILLKRDRRKKMNRGGKINKRKRKNMSRERFWVLNLFILKRKKNCRFAKAIH